VRGETLYLGYVGMPGRSVLLETVLKGIAWKAIGEVLVHRCTGEDSCHRLEAGAPKARKDSCRTGQEQTKSLLGKTGDRQRF
jgi:hypothetical protein